MERGGRGRGEREAGVKNTDFLLFSPKISWVDRRCLGVMRMSIVFCLLFFFYLYFDNLALSVFYASAIFRVFNLEMRKLRLLLKFD